MSKTEAKTKIQALIDSYEKVKSSRQISKYSEEETKKDFIEPLFEALGWNIRDKSEVTAEEHQSNGRADYGFYLDSRLKFYVEAKSLKADLYREEFANQAVRYSWNKGATWTVLTDFENIKIFNAQVIDRSLADKLFIDIPYNQYIERFDQLWLLSKESFASNLLDEEAKKVGKMLQKVSVSASLYKDLNECREILTHNLGLMNKEVDKDLLDEGVQKLLDRLIFLRVAEDRKIEDPILLPLVRESESKGDSKIYQSMIHKFRELDKVYDSNLFSEHPFEKWEEWNGTTKRVINILYGKKGYYEYDFKAMPADVLGGVYENYLGYRLEKSKKGMTVSKDAKKRKEQGIYYTPDFIVDYIVKNTLKPVLDRCKTIADLKKIKVLDPACGSGSFLLKALEVIHNKYIEFGNKGGVWTKVDILLNNIYGVDLDPQAVEIARLNLLINALDQKMELPSLENNIKRGNSLISDKKVDPNAFNWQEEFPEVFKQGGFDVVIGNPPWVFTRGGDFSTPEKNYFSEFLRQLGFIQTEKGRNVQSGKVNLYSLFVIKATTLLNEKGVIGFIIPNNILRATNFDLFRKYILDKTKILEIADLGGDVFKQVTASSIIILLEKESNLDNRINNKIKIISNVIDLLGKQFSVNFVQQKQFINNIKFTFNILSTSNSNNLSKKIIEETVLLGDICKYISPGIDGDKRKYVSDIKLNNQYKPLLFGKNFGRYNIEFKNKWILYDKKMLNRARREDIFLSKKIILQRISGGNNPLKATLDTKKYYTFNSVNNIVLNSNSKYDVCYILGLINSKLMSWFYSLNFSNRSILTVNISKTFLEKLPIKKTDCQKGISSLVNKILLLNEEIKIFEKNSDKWKSVKLEIETIDKKIDEEVYKLYGLTEKEIKIVEGL